MSAPAVERYEHSRLGFVLDLPPGTEVHQDLEGVEGVALLALEPAREDGGFRANVTVAKDAVEPNTPVDAWTDMALDATGRVLERFHVLDREATELAARPAVRTLAHHDVGGCAVVAEQWRVVDGSRAFTITTSCWAMDFAGMRDELAGIAESFALEAAT